MLDIMYNYLKLFYNFYFGYYLGVVTVLIKK